MLRNSLMPIAQGGEVILGQPGRIIVAAAAFLAFATTGNAGILSSSRTPMAMSRDGLVPEFFSKTSKRFNTPHFSLILTTAFMITVILSLSLKDLVKTASTIMIFMFILMNLSVIIMRHSGMQTYRPKFKVPFNPVMPIITIIVYAFLIFEMGKVPLALTGAFSFIAVLWHLFYVQRKIERQSAIVYLVRNIVSKNIQRSGLEEELKQIALQRDEVTFDRFDHLIKDCVILDIKNSISAKELFTQVSEKLSPRLGIKTDKLYDLFIEREKESSTIVKPSLAIPHVVIDGKEIFDVLMVRCKEGVIFSDLQEPVRTAFILIGSADERNYHLRALMTVAHIVSEKGFEERWAIAKNSEQLRDIVLLSSRKRG
jgi:APA family basic amino acid/polyamine antiporter